MSAANLARKMRDLPMAEKFDAGRFRSYPAIMPQAMEHFHSRVEANLALTGRGKSDAFFCDVEKGELVFRRAGEMVVRAPCQIIGTFDLSARRFIWSWGDDAVSPPLSAHAANVRGYGEFHGVAALTAPQVNASETEGWHFAALANFLTGSKGVFRAPGQGMVRFLTLQDIVAV